MDIAVIGPPGAGKGTQAERIAHKFGMVHMSSGNLFRDNLRKQTALGILARRYIRQGELVPDDIVDATVEEQLHKTDPKQGILLDGFPLTQYQAEAMNDFFTNIRGYLDGVIYLKVADEQIVEDRIMGRLTCRQCQRPYHQHYRMPKIENVCDVCQGQLYRRSDDTAEHVPVRLKSFYRRIEWVIEYYQKIGKLIVLDGAKPIEEVEQDFYKVLHALERISYHRATIDEIQQIQSLKQTVTALTPEEVAYPSLDIVLLGAPGAGKGTQAVKLSERLSLEHIATGNIFRENLKMETELGKIAKSYIDRGELVPDDITESMLKDKVSQLDSQAGFILDGFPRTIAQAEALTSIMTDLNRRVGAVIYIKVEDEEIIKRLSGRRVCRKCQTPYHLMFNKPKQEGICDICGGELYQRDDDTSTTVRARLNTFHKQTAPLINYYSKTGLLIEIDGIGQVTEVVNRVMTAVCHLEEAGC